MQPMTMVTSSSITDQLSRKVCLITGGSRTLGAAIARRMARYGAQIAVNYQHSAEAARALCAELSAFGADAQALQADVTQPDQVERLVAETMARFGALDILVNNVGPYVDTP